jgi:hypothetical protein
VISTHRNTRSPGIHRPTLRLAEEIERMMLIARTQRHLFGTVVLARIAQDDHLEEEEAFILPVIRLQLSAAQQEAIITHLLISGHAVPRELPRRATRIAR